MSTDSDQAPEHPLPGMGSSIWLTGQRTLTMQRRGRFVPESGQHPGRMSPDLAAEAIRRFTQPGDVVLDPMCGIGTTLVAAVHAGRHGVGVECEPRWVDVARDNVELAITQGGSGRGLVLSGDARYLNELTSPNPVTSPALPGSRSSTASRASRDPDGGRLDMYQRAARLELARLRGRVRLVLTSPPYGASTHGRVEVPGRDSRRPIVSHLFQHYTDGPGPQRRQRSRRRSSSRRDPVNLAHAGPDELLSGLRDIFAASLPLLAPDAVVVVTARPWRRDGLLIDLPGLVAQAGEDAGLYLADRHVALLAAQRSPQEGGRLVPRHSFHQLLQSRWARERGDDWALISHEDVLIMRLATPGYISLVGPTGAARHCSEPALSSITTAD